MTKALTKNHEKTYVLGFRATAHTKQMVKKLQRKYKQGFSETLRQAIEATYLQEFHMEKEK